MSELKKNTVTPEGLLIWAYVFAPDTTSKFADNKYKINQRFFGEDATKVKTMLDDLATKAAKDLGVDKIDNKLYSVPKDKDKKPIEDAIEVKFKTKTAPQVLDAKKNRLKQSQVPGYKDNCMLGTGNVVFSAVPMEVSGKYYLPLYLQAVRIIDLSTGGVDMSLFDEVEDGFVGEENPGHLMLEETLDDLPDFAAQ